MFLRRAGTQFMVVSLVLTFWVSPVKAQSNQSSAQAQATSKVCNLTSNNDAVITSPSRDFEIASGAQMQFAVSAKGQK